MYLLFETVENSCGMSSEKKCWYGSSEPYRLQKQLSEKESDHQETLKALEAKYNAEIQNLKETISSLEASTTELQKEVKIM